MFHEYFGIAEDPFSITPDTRYLFQSDHHRNAFAHLLYGVADAGGFVQLTGEVGTGKTLLCRSLIAQLPEEVNMALIFNPRQTPLELVASICDELKILYPVGCQSIKEIVDFLNAYLLESYRQGRRTVVMIDEAQNLSYDALEQVRLLTNLETEKQKLLQIILVGQPELRTLLAAPELKQLAQRITARYHLTPLSEEETRDYVQHRLRVAGGDERLFSKDALRHLYRLTGGVPRLINVLSSRSMMAAYAAEQKHIDSALVRRVARELAGEEELPEKRPGWNLGIAAGLLLAVLGYLVWSGSMPLPSGASSEGLAEEVVEPSPQVAAQPSTALASAELETAEITPSISETPQPAEVSDTDIPVNPEPEAEEKSQELVSEAVVPPEPEQVPAAEPEPEPETKPESEPDESLGLIGLLGDQDAAFATLFAYWQKVYPQDDPELSACERAEQVGMSCIYGRGSWQNLELYNRPAVIELGLDDGRRYQVVVSALDADRVTLDLAARRLTFSRQEIASLWTGGYIVLWRPPKLGIEPLTQGMRGRDVAWLISRLDRIEGVLTDFDPDKVRFDRATKQRVMAFQQAQGLVADGIVGRQTIIQMSVAVSDPLTPTLSREGG